MSTEIGAPRGAGTAEPFAHTENRTATANVATRRRTATAKVVTPRWTATAKVVTPRWTVSGRIVILPGGTASFPKAPFAASRTVSLFR